MEKEHLVAIQQNTFGEIMNFKTNTGRIISYRKTVQEIEAGSIEGYDLLPYEHTLPRIHTYENQYSIINQLPLY